MRTRGIRQGLIAVLAVWGAGVSCLGCDLGADGPRDERVSTDVFRDLEERPLDLPRVELQGGSIRQHGVSGRCVEAPDGIPVNAIVFPEIPGVAALGPVGPQRERGPVYAALPEGAPRIVFLRGLPALGDSRWHVIRTLWISRPDYHGPVLVRGGRLDQAGSLGFGARLPPSASLRLPAGEWPPTTGLGAREGGSARRAGWRVTEVPTLLRAPGCYAFQVDGVGFSYVLAFGVQSIG